MFGTCGSEEKIEYLKSLGVHHPINYRKQDFFEEIKKNKGTVGLDAVFDAVGGSSAKKGFKLLGSGGRLIVFGAASITETNIIGKLKMAIGFGMYHPLQFIMSSKSIIGVNMLRIGDDRPQALKRSLTNVVQQVNEGVLDPKIAKIFHIDDLVDALNYLKSRKSIGKISIVWE